MPLYEYKCHKCGKHFERIQKFSDSPVTEHEECGGEVERLISAPALQFKGTGWYVTDYARKGTSGSSGSNGKSESKSEGKSDNKTDTAKTESKPASTSSSSTESKSNSSKD